MVEWTQALEDVGTAPLWRSLIGRVDEGKCNVGSRIKTSLTAVAALFMLSSFPTVTVEASNGGTPPRIAVVFSTSPLSTMQGPSPSHPYMRAFLQGLRDLGYIEGQNILIERRSFEGHWDLAPQVFAELLRLEAQVILAAPLDVARAARKAMLTIPIVVGDATDLGPEPLIASFARPGGTVTGMGLAEVAFSQKQLELLKDVVPRAARVTVLTEALTPELVQVRVKPLEEAARVLNLNLAWTEIKGANQVAPALDATVRQHPQALFVPGGATMFAARRQIADFALRHRLPTMTSYVELVEEGGLMAYAVDNQDIYRRTATYVDRILKGARPGDLAVERPSKFTLLINLKTANALGITIPPSLLLRADRTIQWPMRGDEAYCREFALL